MLSDMNMVLIGASGAIGGNFVAAALAHKARVINLGRHAPTEAEVRHLYADIGSLASLQQAADQAKAELGRVDVVINFAGTHHKPMDFLRDDAEALLSEFDRVIAVNLRGAFVVTQVFGQRLLAQRHGHLIHLASNASRLSLYGSYGYNASKHGLEGLIKTAAAQFAPYGVRVNGVAPGTVETALNRHLLRNPDDGRPTPRAASILAHTPTKRFASLDGITETLLATCVPQRHLTGNLIFCDDGYNVEGHSWPEGNRAVYDSSAAVDALYQRLNDEERP
ncbi:SDR family NAD(P)-dependent oxidoreductase [Roseateles sp. LYH14W]|uniref:SDR family NAD(P)-dependent oxidoreductase n=1 Tax=Pelomonas parva TaxID=3299032 RepID=A0ABW7EVP4_9BURK